MAPFLRCPERSKTFRVESNSYREPNQIGTLFQLLTNGLVLALPNARRSGAQRGASENNFGQRFSVSTPCFFARLGWPSPTPRLKSEIKVKKAEFLFVWLPWVHPPDVGTF
jgi:hypothetical protein